MRVDRWLWAVRLYKTRSLAAKACLAGHVRIAGQSVKPSRDVRIGDLVQARTGYANRTVRVLALLARRVGPKVAAEYVEDLTPGEEFVRARAKAIKDRPLHMAGFGRPTKKQRRQWERLSEGQSKPPALGLRRGGTASADD
jgi:ribosome-associated heat shock protein Hsp15